MRVDLVRRRANGRFQHVRIIRPSVSPWHETAMLPHLRNTHHRPTPPSCWRRRRHPHPEDAEEGRDLLCRRLPRPPLVLLLVLPLLQEKKEKSSVDSSLLDSPAGSPRDEPDEAATAATTKAAEAVERPGFARKLSSFLFGEEQKPTEQLPPPPARRTEPEPAAKFEEMYNQIAAWYSEPENAALRAIWGTHPEPDEFQTWPGFVAVTNAFLDREGG